MVLEAMVESVHGMQVIPPRWVSWTVLRCAVIPVPSSNIPSPPVTVKPSMTTWSAVMCILLIVAPSAMSLIGESVVPDLVIVTSASVRLPPVKHTVLPGEAAARTGRTSSDRVIVLVQSGGSPSLFCWLWSGAAVQPAVRTRPSAMDGTDSVRIPPGTVTPPG